MENKQFLIPLKERSISKFSEFLPKSDKILLFDIDNTLYCESTGLSNCIKEKIYNYALLKGIEREQIKDVCQRYSKEYGLAIKGFLRDFPDTDPEEFDLSVDGSVNLSKFLKVDLELRNLLSQLNYKLYCFTNANYKHAVRVLQALGISDLITGIFYCEYDKFGSFICKPDSVGYEIVERCLEGSKLYFYDDSEKNVVAAKQRGWNSTLINTQNNIKIALNQFIKEERKIIKQQEHLSEQIDRRFGDDVGLEDFAERREKIDARNNEINK